MGQCCKCGKETPHKYTYWSGDLLEPKWRKTCVNVQKHTAFLCSRCAMVNRVIHLAVLSVLLATRLIWPRYNKTDIIVSSIFVAIILGMFLHALLVGWRDWDLPFYAGENLAEKCIIKVMREQNRSEN